MCSCVLTVQHVSHSSMVAVLQSFSSLQVTISQVVQLVQLVCVCYLCVYARDAWETFNIVHTCMHKFDDGLQVCIGVTRHCYNTIIVHI